jgi:NTE family protein
MADALDHYLFTGCTLQELPQETDGVPRFTFSASNLQTGALFSFSQSRVWDWRLGDIERPGLRLAVAVAAASALVPMLSPLELPCQARAEVNGTGSPLDAVAALADGGVIDPLALTPVWGSSRTVLVCDGGPSVPDSVPKADCYLRTADTLRVMHEQLRRVQRSQVLDPPAASSSPGSSWLSSAYCRIDGSENDHADIPSALAATESARFLAMDDSRQEELINAGYSACDVAVRPWLPAETVAHVSRLPYAAATMASPSPCGVAGAA